MARTPKVVEDRRQHIMDAALRVFARKGFSHATNKDIAGEAGITSGLIYHYFESKEALFMALLEERSPLRLAHTLAPEALEQPPDTFLRSWVVQAMEIVEGEQFVNILRLLLSEMVHNPEVAPFGIRILEQLTHFLGGYFAACMERGELCHTNPELAAQVVMGSIMGFVLRRHVLRDPLALSYQREQIVDIVVETALRGLLPRSS